LRKYRNLNIIIQYMDFHIPELIKMENRKFSKDQIVILGACFLIYFCAYIGRLNLSASLEGIMGSLDISATLGGTLQTVFAIVYAAGQFVNGSLVDRFEPKKMILIGLCGSAACNALFFVCNTFILLCIAWALNGAFQSMLWTPIVRYLAAFFTGERRRRASFTMSFTLAGGHIAAWGLAILMQRIFGWRYAFLLPAFVLILAGIFALEVLPALGEKAKENRQNLNIPAKKEPFSYLVKTGLISILFCGMINGFLRDGVVTWAPTILGMDDGVFTLIIPVINLLGILSGNIIVRYVKLRIRVIGALMVCACAVPALTMFVFPGAPVVVLAFTLGLMSAFLYGSNTMFTVLMPMEYDKAGRVGLAAGLIDSLIYLGSALAGAFTGFVRESTGNWQSVYLIWFIAALVACASGILSSRGEKKI